MNPPEATNIVKDAIDILGALLTPMLAIVAAMIAIFQWRLERQKWRLSLYDKRFETYRAITEFVSFICISGHCSHDVEILFLQKAGRNEFLFGPEIKEYINEIYSKSLKKNQLHDAILTHRSESSDGMRGILAEQEGEIADWFAEQFNVVREKFAPYIAITKP